MLEYILFHIKPFQLFVDWLKTKEISFETEIDEDNYLIKIPEDIDDDLLDEVDEKYDAMMDMNQKIVEDQENEDQQGYHMAGIVVTLKDGTVSYADVDPGLLGRVMSAISPEEFGQIVATIADAVETPQPKSYCQRQREQ
ncbi:MAG: hypothetical protein PF589_01040 [Gammaproteobacteria bacterium]|jgi:hypothetical protein|nr:hypothetical protein [Gammaproteobacteria bacterium]